MITKSITSGERAATAVISEETRFLFSTEWNFFHVKNLGTDTVYISMTAGGTAGDDGVIAIPTGESACTAHGYTALSVYVTAAVATDKVQVIGSNIADSPFKLGKKGGGSTEQLGIYPIGADGRPTGDVTVPVGVTSLYEYIFRGNTALTSVDLSGNLLLTTLGSSLFDGCTNLTSITIPNSVTSIGSSTFYNCTKLTSITIPNSVTSIGNSAFRECTKLTSITIPDSVTTVGEYAFRECTGIVIFAINGVVCAFNPGSFYKCTALTTFNTISGFNPTGLNMSTCTALTVDSMVAMFNNLATIGTTKTITLGTTNLAKLSVAEKAIATGKGWTLA